MQPTDRRSRADDETFRSTIFGFAGPAAFVPRSVRTDHGVLARALLRSSAEVQYPMERARRMIIAALVLSTAFLITQYASAIEEGSRAPQFRAESFDGDSVNLRSVRGKVVVVDFWASWCEPCGHAMPALDRIYRRYKEHGLVVIGVSVDERARNARGFLRRTRVSFPVVHDEDHSVAERYSPPTMPSTYVIDRRGVIRHVHAGFRSGDARRLEAQIRDLL